MARATAPSVEPGCGGVGGGRCANALDEALLRGVRRADGEPPAARGQPEFDRAAVAADRFSSRGPARPGGRRSSRRCSGACACAPPARSATAPALHRASAARTAARRSCRRASRPIATTRAGSARCGGRRRGRRAPRRPVRCIGTHIYIIVPGTRPVIVEAPAIGASELATRPVSVIRGQPPVSPSC